jgi:hypothetical protein
VSGREEGVYGWLAANYLDQRLHSSINHQQENSDQISPSDHPTIGVLEMGGASMQVCCKLHIFFNFRFVLMQLFSTQVSFVPADMNSADRNELVTVKLGSAVFPLYTHSYLNFGMNFMVFFRIAESTILIVIFSPSRTRTSSVAAA